MKWILTLFICVSSFSLLAQEPSVPAKEQVGWYYTRSFTVIFNQYSPYPNIYKYRTFTSQAAADAAEAELRSQYVEGKNYVVDVKVSGGSGPNVIHYTCPPDGYPNHTAQSNDGKMCNYVAPPEPKCSDPEVQKSFQVDQFNCQSNNPNPAYFDAVFTPYCTDNPFSTSHTCEYVSNGCVINCPVPEEPHCNPATQECSIPDQLPPPDQPPETNDPLDGLTGVPDTDICADLGVCETRPDDCIAPAEAPWLCHVPDLTPQPDYPNPPAATIEGQESTIESVRDLNKTNQQILDQVQHLGELSVKGIEQQKEFISAALDKADKQAKLSESLIHSSNAMASSALSTQKAMAAMNSGVSALNIELEKLNTQKFCEKNPEFPACIQKTPFGELPQIAETSPFDGVISEQKVNQLKTESEEIKTQLHTLMNQYKTDLSIGLSLPTSGTISDPSLTLHKAGHQLNVQNTYWSDNTTAISAGVLLISTLVAFSIVFARRN